eukprot:1182713-Prorocentrum_minimum.AAC.6
MLGQFVHPLRRLLVYRPSPSVRLLPFRVSLSHHLEPAIPLLELALDLHEDVPPVLLPHPPARRRHTPKLRCFAIVFTTPVLSSLAVTSPSSHPSRWSAGRSPRPTL